MFDGLFTIIRFPNRRSWHGISIRSFFNFSVYIFIFNKISILFRVYFLYLACSCPYSYNPIDISLAEDWLVLCCSSVFLFWDNVMFLWFSVNHTIFINTFKIFKILINMHDWINTYCFSLNIYHEMILTYVNPFKINKQPFLIDILLEIRW